MKQVVTRFAPSPTGSLHIGGLRSALYPYAFARQQGGVFILRIEDTDQKREVEGSAQQIQELLTSFGFTWDQFYIQSQRAEAGLYSSLAHKLVEQGNAFYCQCDARNAKKDGYSAELRDPCRDLGYTSGAIKLRVPDNETVTYYDLVFKKDVSWNTSDVADATLLKSDGILPTYHLAMPIDDHDMGITHVFRGHDWLPSTPIHLLVFKYLGYELPAIGHLSDIQDPEGGKLSKRKGSTSCEGLLADGYLHEALINFVALCGWAPKDNREMFTLDELVESFSLDGIQKANPVFNREKLDWFNREYIKKLSPEEQMDHVRPRLEQVAGYKEELLAKVTPHVIERISSFGEIADLLEQGEISYYFTAPTFSDENKKMLVWKTSTLEVALENLKQVLNLLETFSGDWNSYDELKNFLMPLAEEKGKGDVLWPLRVSLCGKDKSPDPFTLLSILGKNESLVRIKNLVQ